MTTALTPGAWQRGVVAESARYWLRRNRTLLVVVTGAVLVGGALVAVDETDRSGTILAMTVGWGPLVAGLLTMSGIVSSELESGLVVMWFQKPGTLVRPYFVRYLIGQALLATFAVLLAAVAGGIGAAAGLLPAARVLRLPLMAAAVALIPAAMVFALSSWGVRRDASIAVILMVSSLAVAAALAFDQSLMARAVRSVVFPLDAIEALSGASPVTHTLGWPLAVVVGQIVAWSALGAVGLRHTERALRRGG